MSERPPGDMPVEEFRKAAHQVSDWIAEFFQQIDSLPVLPSVMPGATVAALPSHAPEQGEPMSAILADFERVIFPALTHWNHPGFMAYFANSASGPSILAEMLATALNPNGMLWRTCPGSAELEQVTLDWLWQLLGLPDRCFGMIHDTASTATLHAVVAAREALEDFPIRTKGQSGLPPLVMYTSQQANSSVEKAGITLGIGQDNIRKIEVDGEFRIKPEALDAAIAADLLAGSKPFCVVATVGTTSTASVDPVPRIAEICRRRRLWLHVDAAYAGVAAMVPELSHTLAGCDRADSLVVNPHKWLFVPMDLSAFYCRRPDILRRAFSLTPPYLQAAEDPKAVNFTDFAVPLGRRFRSLKLWFVLRYFGREGIVAILREHIRLAQDFAARIKAHPDFELMAPAAFSTVCFRFRPARISETQAQRLNTSLVEVVNASGKVFLSSTRLHDKLTIRLTLGNIRTAQSHVDQAWELLCSKARDLTQ